MKENNKLEKAVISFLGGVENIKFAFILFVCGFISHIGVWAYKVASTDANCNGLFYYTSDWETSLGRWLIPQMDSAKYYFCFPILSTILALAYISVAAVVALNVLEVKDRILKIIAGILFIVTPCVSFSLMFFYCADSYGLSVLLASLFVLIIKKDNSIKNFILAMLCIVGSLALYQAYIGYAATLCISLLIIYLFNNKELMLIIKKGIYMVCCALAGTILYYIITKIVHSLTGLQFADYGGANSLGSTTLLDIKIAVALSYQKFYELFLGYMGLESTQFFRSHSIFILIIVCSVLAMIMLIIQNKLYKEPLRILFILGAFAIYPFVNGIVLLISKNHGFHNLMVQSYYIIFILLAAIMELYQNAEPLKAKFINPVVVTALFCVFVAGFSFELLAVNNATYEYYNIKRNKMDSIANRVLSDAENLEGYNEASGFVFAGKLDSSYPIDTYLEKMAFVNAGVLSPANLFQNNAVIENIYREDLGCYIHICDDETYVNVINSDEYKNMPVYPQNGSVKMIGDVVVVKLNEKVFMPE